jgi:hypothetical protein
VTRPATDGAHLISRYSERPAHELAQIIATEFPRHLDCLEWHEIEAGETTLRRVLRPAGLTVEPLGPVWSGDPGRRA